MFRLKYVVSTPFWEVEGVVKDERMRTGEVSKLKDALVIPVDSNSGTKLILGRNYSEKLLDYFRPL